MAIGISCADECDLDRCYRLCSWRRDGKASAACKPSTASTCCPLTQVHMAAGHPKFYVVGLPDKAESRVRAALSAIGLGLSYKRITVNLAPADVTGRRGAVDALAAPCITGRGGSSGAEGGRGRKREHGAVYPSGAKPVAAPATVSGEGRRTARHWDDREGCVRPLTREARRPAATARSPARDACAGIINEPARWVSCS